MSLRLALLLLSCLFLSSFCWCEEIGKATGAELETKVEPKEKIPPEIKRFCEQGPEQSLWCDHYTIVATKGPKEAVPKLGPADLHYRINIFCKENNLVVTPSLITYYKGQPVANPLRTLTDMKINHEMGVDGQTDQSILYVGDTKNGLITLNFHHLNTGLEFNIMATTGNVEATMTCHREEEKQLFPHLHPKSIGLVGPDDPTGTYTLLPDKGQAKFPDVEAKGPAFPSVKDKRHTKFPDVKDKRAAKLKIDMIGNKPVFHMGTVDIGEASEEYKGDGTMKATTMHPAGMQVRVQWAGRENGDMWVMHPVYGVLHYKILKDEGSKSAELAPILDLQPPKKSGGG